MKIFNKSEFVVFSFVVLIALFSGSCEKDTISGDVVSNPELASELNSKSTDTLSFESNDYIPEAELYRNFFPGVPLPKRRPLIASIFLVNTDSVPVSENLSIKKLYVINSNQVWIADLREGANPYIPDFKLHMVNTNGPEWDTGIRADVVLEIKNKITLDSYYLIAREQLIQRLD